MLTRRLHTFGQVLKNVFCILGYIRLEHVVVCILLGTCIEPFLTHHCRKRRRWRYYLALGTRPSSCLGCCCCCCCSRCCCRRSSSSWHCSARANRAAGAAGAAEGAAAAGLQRGRQQQQHCHRCCCRRWVFEVGWRCCCRRCPAAAGPSTTG